MALIVRQLGEKDYEPYGRLFEDSYAEYLDFLRVNNPQQYEKEKQEKRKATRARFNFYLKTGSSFVAEEKGKVMGYVASQTVSYMHGVGKLLWIEYVVVKSEFWRQGVGTALLNRLRDYAKTHDINRTYTTINPDNEASIKLHKKVGFNVKNWDVASLRLRESQTARTESYYY